VKPIADDRLLVALTLDNFYFSAIFNEVVLRGLIFEGDFILPPGFVSQKQLVKLKPINDNRN